MSAVLSATDGPKKHPDDPVIPIEVRLPILYREVRALPERWVLADSIWMPMQYQLPRLAAAIAEGTYNGSVTLAAKEATERRAALLDATEKALIELRDMEDGRVVGRVHALHHPATPPPTRADLARANLDTMQQLGGFRFELHQKSFRVTPASKLTDAQKDTLTSLRAEITAELQRRADAWSPG